MSQQTVFEPLPCAETENDRHFQQALTLEQGNELGSLVPVHPQPNFKFILPSVLGDELSFFQALYNRPTSASTIADSVFKLESSGLSHIRKQRSSKRQAQNREAQRRFRERREQERLHLMKLLEKLQTENIQISNLLEQSQKHCLTLEAGTKQLQAEAELLRRWQQKVMCSMAELVQLGDPMDDVLTVPISGCSYECWRKGMQQLRAFVAMKTMASLLQTFDPHYSDIEPSAGDHGA